MAACSVCRKPITSTQAARAEKVLNEKGQLIGQRHGKCGRIADRRARNANDPDRAGANAPTAYEAAAKFSGDRRISKEEAAAQEAQAKIAAERAKELDERRFDDWRSDGAETLEDDSLGTGESLDFGSLDK